MVTLVSPGVDVQIIDESFYTSAGPGTVPFILIATEENKSSPSGDGAIAPGTLKENADELYLITSQRELIQTFGNPTFKSLSGTPLHGNELNEYGLHAAYSYMGVSNRAYVMRADVDLGQLDGVDIAPVGDPVAGTYWFNVAQTAWGVFRSSGSDGNPATSAYNDWSTQSVYVVDRNSRAETVRLGSIYAPTDTTPVIAGPGDLVINGETISFVGNEDLVSAGGIVDLINSAAITNIEASAYYTPKGVRLKIRNTAVGGIELTGTDSNIATDIGMVVADDPIIQPNVDIATSDGDFAVVTLDSQNRVYERLLAQDADGNPLASLAEWRQVGTIEWAYALPSKSTSSTTPTIGSGDDLTVTMTFAGGVTETQTISASGTTVAAVVGDLNTAFSAYVSSLQAEFAEVAGALVMINNDGGEITATGTLAGASAMDIEDVKARELYYASHTAIPDGSREGDVWVKTTEPNNGSNYVVSLYDSSVSQWVSIDAPFYSDDTAATAAYGASAAAGVLYVEYDAADEGVANHTIKRWDGSAWSPLVYEASAASPTSAPADGTKWYNTDFAVDLMVSTGSTWVGLNNHPYYANADIILSASRPLQKPAGSTNGTTLVDNDIWINTSDLENYPRMYRYVSSSMSWEAIDTTDQSTPFGVVFGDARQDDGSGNTDAESLATSNYVDPDALDPLLYPNGLIMFNTRYSTLNVKEWQSDYLADYTEAGLLARGEPTQYTVGTATFDAIEDGAQGRWITVSGNQADGRPYMGRKAQRRVIVNAMAGAVSASEDLRAETIFYNLIAAPGYVELLDELVTLNTDKKEVAFIVTDTPARLQPNGTALQNWATNANDAISNGEEGLTTAYTYSAVYYPWGISTNVDGAEVMVPPSTMALRTYAYNDQVAYPWFAPAGYNRGIVSNATNVGYLTAEDEFKPARLNEGLRDVMYTNNMNPISFMDGQGLVVFGQKTLQPTDSALDRVNVARLVNYLRYQLDRLANPFLFEPNDQTTRDGLKDTIDRFLGDLIGLRGITDFATVCDTSNNTPARIDRNELWVDVAIVPTRAVEFIYIPVRILNTGDI